MIFLGKLVIAKKSNQGAAEFENVPSVFETRETPTIVADKGDEVAKIEERTSNDDNLSEKTNVCSSAQERHSDTAKLRENGKAMTYAQVAAPKQKGSDVRILIGASTHKNVQSNAKEQDMGQEIITSTTTSVGVSKHNTNLKPNLKVIENYTEGDIKKGESVRSDERNWNLLLLKRKILN